MSNAALKRPETPVLALTGDSYATGVVNTLFLAWVFSLPFYNFSLIGTYSVDDLLVPVLLLLWPFVKTPADPAYRIRRTKAITLSIILILVFVFGIAISFLTSLDLFVSKSYLNFRRALYMIIPLLYIRTAGMLIRANSVIILVAVMGALSALLASLGILDLAVQRVTDSRLGIDTLPKAVGLFSNYGDMAMLMSYTVLLLIAFPKEHFKYGIGSFLGKSVVLSCLLLGYLGLQSRNIVLSVSMATIAYLVIGELYKRAPMARMAVGAVLTSLAAIAFMGLLFFSSQIIDLLSNWGGRSASGSAASRLYQYEIAARFINEAFVSGIGPETHRKFGYILDGVHNMWLYILMQGGMISVFAMVGLLLRAFLGAVRHLRDGTPLSRAGRVGGATVMAMLVATMFYAGAGKIFWFMLGIVSSIGIIHWKTVHTPKVDAPRRREHSVVLARKLPQT